MSSIADDAKDVFFFIPHTHWEGAVFKTREAYLKMGLPNILRALRLLKRYPNYRFTLDQVCYVKPFLERYPEEETALRQFMAEGRLAIVGGTDVMLDVNMPGGESFVRQVLYGKRYFREALGVDVTVGWQLDTFGHHAQMPQLLKLAGYRSFWFFRGVADWDVPAEFHWEGIDGSRIPAFWLAHGYAVTYGSPRSAPEFADFFKARFELLAPFARGRGRVGLAGADVCVPEEHVAPLVEEFNRAADAPFELRLAVPADYEEFVAQQRELPVVTGELNPIFQGIYSSRIELKQRTRELERLLTTAEKLGALLRWCGTAVDDANVWHAWEPMLFNQAHDLMSGVMTDAVHEDTIRGFDFSRRLAEDEVDARLDSYISHLDTRGEGIPAVVFNPLGWARTDIVFVDVGFSDAAVVDVEVVDPEGETVPVQLIQAERDAAGALIHAEIAFVAHDVPAMGHCVYRVLPLTSNKTAAMADTARAGAAILENEHYRIECDASGAITSLIVKQEGWEALRDSSNVVAQQPDHGDLWEPYRPLNGGSRIAMKEKHGVPAADEAIFSNAQTSEPNWTAGPVFTEFTVAHPFGDKGSFATRVHLYTSLRRIEIRTQILNNDEFVRYRALFPTSIGLGQTGVNGRTVHEIPFGAIERPAGIEFPAQNWIDHSDGEHGVALLNRGLPGNNVDDGTLMLSLCRSTRIVAYGFGGGYEPGMSSDSGLELGKEFTFDYALLPHAGDWRAAAIHREGLEFNNPLLARTAAVHEGALPARWGCLRISHPNIVISALTLGDHGTVVLRVYETTGEATPAVRIEFAQPVTAAEEVDLMEQPIASLDVADGGIQFDLGQFEIKTVKLHSTG